ncbi:MAG TPA: tellurite resistance/C4-dicarboxylate transporter family protein [Solirubrobacteraceae bacterium]|nr:tellurite resistance/C4-dicarboxylate transporter family protein [Solirubrobacteraceae bacterium]
MSTLGGGAVGLERVLEAIPPAAGAEVMGTGIVSVALSLDHHETLSRILLVIAAAMWVTLAVLVPLRARRDRARFLADIQTPPALTSVAGTAVLGTRLALLGWTWAGIAALVLATAIWALLIGVVLSHWKTPTVGASLIITVSTESLAVLAATIGLVERMGWLLVTGLAPFALGLCFYVFVIARFDLHQLAVGRGDHWITGGALAISTLAAGKLLAGAKALAILGGGGGILKDGAIVLWVLTMLWLPVLLLAELLHPRLHYDVRRWSTVFPFGMYAACSFAVGAAAHVGAITSFARVWVWIALAVWAAVLAAMINRGVQAAW